MSEAGKQNKIHPLTSGSYLVSEYYISPHKHQNYCYDASDVRT